MTRILLDCDPGHDDAIALLLALASPEVVLLGVTTVAGNQTLEKTTANAIRVLEFVGRDQDDCDPGRCCHLAERQLHAGLAQAGQRVACVRIGSHTADHSHVGAETCRRHGLIRALAPGDALERRAGEGLPRPR